MCNKYYIVIELSVPFQSIVSNSSDQQFTLLELRHFVGFYKWSNVSLGTYEQWCAMLGTRRNR